MSIVWPLLVMSLSVPDTIVVTGKRESDRRSTIAEVVKSVAPPAVDGQWGGWRAPICVGVSGATREATQPIMTTIEAVASEAGMRVAKRPCRTNVSVALTRDAGKLVTSIVRKNRNALAQASARERQDLLAGDAPVRWWYLYRTLGSDGRPLLGEAAAIGANASPTNGIALPARVGSSYHATGIDTKISVELEHVVVVIDARRAEGYALDAVAAYVARVALAPKRFRPMPSPEPGVLELFAVNGERPAGLSSFDRAYLRAYARLPRERAVGAQRGRLITMLLATE